MTTGLLYPKPTPSCLRKQAMRQAEKNAERTCYRLVTKREGGRSRLSGKRGEEHHHILARSLGGRHTPENVVLLTSVEHAWVKQGLMKVSGNAEVLGGLTFWLDRRVSQSGQDETVTR